MGASLNKVILIGRLTANPESRTTTTGKKVVSFALAVDRRGREAATDFIPITVWDKLAEICEKYLVKGKLIAIEGRLQTRTYEVEGQKRRAFDVVASDMTMLSSRSEGGEGYSRSSSQYSDAPAAPAPDSYASGAYSDNGDLGDMDVPF